MQTLYANETNNAKKYRSKLTEKTMNLIFQMSTKIEVNLYCENRGLSYTRTEGSKVCEIYRYFTL
jgi:hypothetical protein